MKTRNHLIALLAAASLAGEASAQSTAFTYQGSLNQSGAAATGSFDFQFTLKDALTGGANVGTPATVSVNGVAVANGIFTVSLDFGAAVFNGANRWLEIGVRPAGGGAFTNLAPRQPVAPNPTALSATKIAAGGLVSAEAIPYTANAPTSGNPTNGGAALYVPSQSGGSGGRGGIVHHQDDLFAFLQNVYSSDTQNGARMEFSLVERANPLAVPFPGILTIRGDGNVGIGTRFPDASLHVIGPVLAGLGQDEGVTFSWSRAAQRFTQASTSAYSLTTHLDNTGIHWQSNSTSRGFIWDVAGSEKMRLSPGGYVGIGTSDPTAPLHIRGTQALENGGLLTLGNPSLFHMVFNENEIQVFDREPGEPQLTTTLFLNPKGGDIQISDLGKGATTTVFGTFSNLSDRSAKEDFAEVTPEEVLERLVDLPISTWRYKGEHERRHVGPVSQDFHEAFDELLDLNSSDKTIAPLDEAGVAFASIQALHRIVEQKDGEIGELRSRLERLEARFSEMAVPE